MNDQEAKIFLNGLFDTFNNQDWNLLFKKYIWEDCQFINGNGVHQGKEEMIQYWEEVSKTKKETLFKPFNLFVKDNHIAAELLLEFEFFLDHVFAEVSFKKGDKIILRTADFYTLKGNKVSHFIVYRFSPWSLKPWENKLNEFEKIVRKQ